MSGLPKPEVDHVRACSPCLDLQAVDDREDVRGQVGDAAELHGDAPTLVVAALHPTVVARWSGSATSRDRLSARVATCAVMANTAARRLHPRRDRDPPRQPQQVRDRPRHRPGLPRPAAVHGHHLSGRLRLHPRHARRRRRSARRARAARGPGVPRRVGARPGRSGVLYMHDEAGDDAKIICVPPARAALGRRATTSTTSRRSCVDEIQHFFEVYKALEPGKTRRPPASPAATAAWREIDEARGRTTSPTAPRRR